MCEKNQSAKSCKYYFLQFMLKSRYIISIRCTDFLYTSEEFHFLLYSVAIFPLISYPYNIATSKFPLATSCNCCKSSKVIQPPCSSCMQVNSNSTYF